MDLLEMKLFHVYSLVSHDCSVKLNIFLHTLSLVICHFVQKCVETTLINCSLVSGFSFPGGFIGH